MNIKNYIFINQLALKIVGFYPISIMRYFMCISCIILLVVAQIIKIFNNWNDLNIVLEISSTSFTLSVTVLKSIIWMINRKNLEFFIHFMLTDYWKMIKPNVFIYLQKYAIYAKIISMAYFISMCNALLFFYSLPIIEILIDKNTDSSNNATTKKLPFIIAYPLIFHKFPFYEIMYMFQILATSICCLIILSTDALIATALLHTCGHFAVLDKKLKELDSSICCLNNSKNSLKMNVNLYDIKIQVIHVIQHHQIIIWFCNNMEKNFYLILFLQVMSSSFIICFVGFQVFTALTEQYKLIKFSSYLVMTFFQLLLFCFPGDILIRQSFGISTAVYSIQWYKLPSFIKDEVYMIMLRSQKSCCITAGKIYVMHLENFSAILGTAFSYFMMLRSFNSET